MTAAVGTLDWALAVFEKEAALVPGSRTHFYTRYLGASRHVRRGPLP